jgi:hypothetical protein
MRFTKEEKELIKRINLKLNPNLTKREKELREEQRKRLEKEFEEWKRQNGYLD